MTILAIESSGLVASAAILENDILKGEFTINNKLTHSETLLPMLKELSQISGIELEGIDAIAVSSGPGSFTGLRIGAATAKGLALALNLPIISVPTLRAMAEGIGEFTDYIVCPIMDARRGQVYAAAYCCGEYLIPEGAISITELTERLKDVLDDLSGQTGLRTGANTGHQNCRIIFTGDGVPVHKEKLEEAFAEKALFAGAGLNRQRAANVGILGIRYYMEWLKAHELTPDKVRETGADSINCYDGYVMNSDEFVPDYMRKTQAERELQAGILEDPGQHSLKKLSKGDRPREQAE